MVTQKDNWEQNLGPLKSLLFFLSLSPIHHSWKKRLAQSLLVAVWKLAFFLSFEWDT